MSEPVAVPGLEIPAWVPESSRKSLNGGSAHRTTTRARFTVPGDGIVGTVLMLRDTHAIGGRHGERTPVIVLRVTAGQMNGAPVKSGEWVELFCTARDLRTFYDWHEPREGDTISVLYGGERESGFGLPRKSFAIGIERAEGTTEESGGNRW